MRAGVILLIDGRRYFNIVQYSKNLEYTWNIPGASARSAGLLRLPRHLPELRLWGMRRRFAYVVPRRFR
jgi:hypothetical protein